MKKTFTARQLGCIIDGSCDSATNLNLATIALAREYGAKLGRLPSKKSEDYDQIVSEMADSGVDHLNCLENLPDYCSFFFQDNCLFFMPSVENAKEDCEFVSSRAAEYPPDDYRGLWMHVSDHGNATLYCRKNADAFAKNPPRDVEIWAVV